MGVTRVVCDQGNGTPAARAFIAACTNSCLTVSMSALVMALGMLKSLDPSYVIVCPGMTRAEGASGASPLGW